MNKAVWISMLVLSSAMIIPSQAQEAPPRGGPGADGQRGERPNDGQGRNGDGRGRNGDGRGGRGNIDADANLVNAEENLQALIAEREISPIDVEDLDLPGITDAKAQLGKQLFFAKNLGGENSSACVSCHHPTLGGGDNLSLSVGVDAVNELDISSHDLLGLGRFNDNDANNLPAVPRNAPTVFNLGLNNRRMFWDGRVERRRNQGILTPDSPLSEDGDRLADPNLPAGATLAAAQARFPVTSVEEMRGDFASGSDNQDLRAQLTTRFDNSDGDYVSNWPALFAQAYGDTNVTFDRIADALGEYERSMVFIDNPWQAYLNGDSDALTDQQKAGALVFFRSRRDGGAGCAGCHRGDTFSGGRHNLVAFPQFGPGKGNASTTDTPHDFGRENITGDIEDRMHFRPPTLLNIAVTGPYGHTGAFQTLEEVVDHYSNPRESINTLFAAQGNEAFVDGEAPFCQLPQIVDLMQKNNQTCESLYPDAYANSIAAVEHLEAARNDEVEASGALRGSPNLSPEVVAQVVAFLNALTDPCVENRDCLAPWIVDESNEAEFPDNNPLIAHDRDNNAL
ncbi:cytochrome C peroxidase [Thalassomonas viridans]|uniref:Cytochrome C peroxidase n=1 Tax=Thalassomonas viridans TaxID=137584 RepID=A0AAE9Z5K8_9GAMM|nr:cytochrome c peroxidase [Thalassomonas viridans]WDE07161.1 cytochrome C peroxidase [Thalassomonas viridans]